jgi:hypothetical protein
MKHWIPTLATLLFVQPVLADADIFSTGDYVFVKAQIIGCDSKLRFVEVGQILDTGQVTLFDDIQLETSGKTTSEITVQLVGLLEQRTGHRSKTIEIMRVSSEDSKTAAQLMMIIHSERSRGCTEKPTPDDRLKLKEWLRIAYELSHNKAFKFVPVLRTSTGPKKAAPFWAA